MPVIRVLSHWSIFWGEHAMDCCSRRLFLIGATGVAGAAFANQAEAQRYPLLCSYGGGPNFGHGLSPGSMFAVSQLRAICTAIGYQFPVSIYMGGVPNASATIINGQQAVIYNADFLGALYQCNAIAGASVIAHEVGHHATGDTWVYGRLKHPWGKELGADWVSGFAMARLRVPLDDAISGIQCAFGEFGPPPSISHPDGRRRLEAIEQGWLAA